MTKLFVNTRGYAEGTGGRSRTNAATLNNLFRLPYQNDSLAEIELDLRNVPDRFHPLVIKECFFCLAVGGRMHLLNAPKAAISFANHYLLEAEGKPAGRGEIVVAKYARSFEPADTMDHWTFGIITNGARDEWVNEIIRSIRRQKIRNFEILICGSTSIKEGNGIRILRFAKKTDLGWITLKKNMIMENAKYQNIALLHDRVILSKDWFKGMRKYGNSFEALAVPFEDGNGNERGTWMMLNYFDEEYREALFACNLEKEDWDPCAYLPGYFFIIKKKVAQKVKMNESFLWQEVEDAMYSRDLLRWGYILRYNPYSHCMFLGSREQGSEVGAGEDAGMVELMGKRLYWNSRLSQTALYYLLYLLGTGGKRAYLKIRNMVYEFLFSIKYAKRKTRKFFRFSI